VAFHIYEDDEGLGAEEVEVTAEAPPDAGGGKNGAAKGKSFDKGKGKNFGKAPDWSKGAGAGWGAGWGKAAAPPQTASTGVMCRFFLEGRCSKGDACSFSHGSQAPAKGGKSWGKASAPYVKAGAKSDVFGKGKDKGKDKGKGKHKTPGHTLEKTRITAEKFTGEVTKWQGKFGFIKPAEPVEHEKAEKHDGCLFVSINDIEGDTKELTVGSLCEFHIYEDKSGLGAEEVVQF